MSQELENEDLLCAGCGRGERAVRNLAKALELRQIIVTRYT